MRDSKCCFFSILLSLLLTCPAMGGPQQGQDLNIVVTAGEGAMHNLARGIVTAPAVEVHDAQGTPVANAEVVFRCPPTGPTGTFYAASRETAVTTDASGRATASGFMPNGDGGSYEIEVTATHQGRTASTSIPQTNIVEPVRPKTKKGIFGWRLIAALLGGAAIVVTAIILRDSESGSAGPALENPAATPDGRQGSTDLER